MCVDLEVATPASKLTNACDNKFLSMRHARTWINPAALASLRIGRAEQRVIIEQHAQRGFPFVVRRMQPCDFGMLVTTSDDVPLGLRLPRSAAVRSLSFCAPRAALTACADAITLVDVLASVESLPAGWSGALQLLEHRAQDIGLTLRVYGSLVWQSVTGARYLADDSDVDLLLRPQSLLQAKAGLALLKEFSDEGVMRLDGEMVFPDGRAVAWKELLGNTRDVLVKTSTGVELIQTELIWKQAVWH